MPFCFAPCLTGFTTGTAVAASTTYYVELIELQRLMDKTDIYTILLPTKTTLAPRRGAKSIVIYVLIASESASAELGSAY